MKWQFKGKPPASIYVIFVLLWVNLLGQMATSFLIPKWSPITPDAVHSYFVRFKGMAGYYVEPWLGAYFVYGFWLHFVLLALLFLLFWLHRDEIERVR
jgi:glycerol-3-phosphate acyltransferase PlsY